MQLTQRAQTTRALELLAPAKDLETAREAVLHGADAVYVGAPRFGARASAGVSLEDLRELTQWAHLWGVRIYVALNTILYDHELQEAEELIWQIYHAGADALIIQDMGITRLNLPQIPLHASTQCDTTTAEDAAHLEAMGFEQIVVARELNTEQIRRIHQRVGTRLEGFVHGALCVSYSGRCYLSQALVSRSANRGECSQQCRLPYNLIDAQGKSIRRGEHLLSPRDLNRSQLLEELADAGISSFKVEGRLKSISYVKNITAYYRQQLDRLIAQYPDRYHRASYGQSSIDFTPQPERSFNRGFTDYQLQTPSKKSPQPSHINPLTPKSMGERIGTVRQVKGRQVLIDTDHSLVSGDGFMVITPNQQTDGLRANRVDGQGRIELARAVDLPRGSILYRNHDHAWEQMLQRPTARRIHSLELTLRVSPQGLELYGRLSELPSIEVRVSDSFAIEPAQRYDEARLLSELGKWGGSLYEATGISLEKQGVEQPFVPLSRLSALRRALAEELTARLTAYFQPLRNEDTPRMRDIPAGTLPGRRRDFVADYRANAANRLALEHYRLQGYPDVAPAYEVERSAGAEMMCTKHCIRHELGYCTREQSSPLPWSEPLYLEHEGKRLRLSFDCTHCQMLIYLGA